MMKPRRRIVWAICIATTLILAPATLQAQWRAPNVHTIFSGSTFGSGQSQNMGPALNHTFTEYCTRGGCDAGDDGDQCDTLRFGLTMYPAVDGRRNVCGVGNEVSNTVVSPQEDGCFEMGGALKHMQNRAGREYCDQSRDGWQYEPLDEVLRLGRETTFAEGYDAGSSVDNGVLSRWWERANLNLVMLERLPQTDDDESDGRIKAALRQACKSYNRDTDALVPEFQFPAMPTFVLGMKDNAPDVSLFGGLLAAAGGTGRCCYDSDGTGCDIEDDVIDVCAHLDEPGRTEEAIRDDIEAGAYRCGGSGELTVTGAPMTRTLPNLECALAAQKCNGAFAPEPPTDFFGIFSCIQVRPQEADPEEFAVEYCYDDAMNCDILRKDEGIQYIDENKTLYYVEGVNDDGTSYCTGLGDDNATVEPWECPNEGKRCDTGLPGRCGVGEISCASGEEECVQKLAPMPEICNGLDDDCTGHIDNLSDSWDADLFSVYEPTEMGTYDADDIDRTAIHCLERDVCTCAGGETLDYGGPGYEAHIMSWKPGTCVCGEGLDDQASGGFTPAPVAPEPQAGCSAASSGMRAAKIGALLFALLVLIVCRRKRTTRA